MILHDFKCEIHGDFEGTHPICPENGCESENVVKLFRKSPMIFSGMTRATDRGLRESADSMGITNFRSARPGEASFGGEQAGQVLWGDQVKKSMPGMDMNSLIDQSVQQTINLKKQTIKIDKPLLTGIHMMDDIGVTTRQLPPAKIVARYTET